MAKKTTGTPETSVRVIKQTLTKSALINLIAEQNDIPRKTAIGVFNTLESVMLGSIHRRGVGEFTFPGLFKITLRKVPARKAGTLIRNPATGQILRAVPCAGAAQVGEALARARAAQPIHSRSLPRATCTCRPSRIPASVSLSKYARYSGRFAFWTAATFCSSRAERFHGFFCSAKRVCFSSRFSSGAAARTCSRRTSSSAS